MPEKNQALGDSLMRIAASAMQPKMTREQWIAKFARINLRSIVAVVPDVEVYNLDASWVLARVGSFWRADEEYHVYAMEHSVKTMIKHRQDRPQMDMVVITPIWVFQRVDSRATPVASEDVLRVAEQNFMKFFGEIYKRWTTDG